MPQFTKLSLDNIFFGLGLFLVALLILILVRGKRTIGSILKLKSFTELEWKQTKLQGQEIHWGEGGSGPALIFLHGIGASSYSWSLLWPLLINKYRVFVLDLPGFGLSPVLEKKWSLDGISSLLKDFIHEQGLKNYVLIGSSMGGAIALRLAQLDEGNCRGLIALAPATSPKLTPLPLAWLSYFHPILKPVVGTWFIKHALKRVRAGTTPVTDLDLAHYHRPYSSNSRNVANFLAATQVLRDRRMPALFESLKIPVLVLYGRQDRLVPVKVVEDLVRILPKAQLETLALAGHHLQEDDPEWTSEKILSFLKTL